MVAGDAGAAAPASAAGGDEAPPAVPVPAPAPALMAAQSVEVSLACICVKQPVKASLRRGSGAWHVDVDLPAAGVWRTSLVVDDQPAVAPVALRVDDAAAPGPLR